MTELRALVASDRCSAEDVHDSAWYVVHGGLRPSQSVKSPARLTVGGSERASKGERARAVVTLEREAHCEDTHTG